jgi:chromosome segregation ATPase
MKFNGQKQPIDSFTNSIQPLKEKIENFERMLNLQAESNQIINKKIDCLTAYLNDLSENMNEIESVHVIEKKLDTLGVYFDELSKKMSELKAVPEFDGEFEDLNLKISNLVKEIAETKTNEIVTAQNLKSLLEKISILSQEMKNQKLTDPLLEEKIDSLQGQIATINDSILQSNLQTQKTMAGIEEKMNGFSQIEKELDSLKNHTVHSIDELCETQNQLCESQKQMGNLLISQEQITKNIVNDAVLKIQKMLTKTKKRRVIKPTRAKVVRFLKKNFKIKPFSKVLVITDKHNSTFGKTLYEATRAVNKKSVLAVMENRTEKSSLDRQVIEAVKQSNYVFIIGKYSVKKVRKLSKTLPKARVMSVRRTLRYSVL